MATIVAVGLLVIAVILFLAVRKRWISGDTLKTLADIAGVLALIAAVAMFIVPSPTLHEPTSESSVAKNCGNNRHQTACLSTTVSVTGEALEREP